MRRIWKKLFLGLAVSAVVVAAFLIYSTIVTFTIWPWTQSRPVVGDEAFGFAAGASKSDTLNHAMKLQLAGKILAVRPADLAPTTSGDRFIGYPLVAEDIDRLEPANIWNIRIASSNAWFVLEFHMEKLSHIERKDYHGPTE